MKISNPIIPGFNPDPSICQVGPDYYLATSSFEYTPGIPLYHSRDLVHWTHVAYALPAPGILDFSRCKPSLALWAPTLRHINGRFHVVVTFTTGVGKWPECHCNYLMSAPAITGPWSEPVFICNGGIDPDLFQDDDGTVYYTQNLGAKTAPICLDSGRLLAPLRTLWEGTGDAWPEAPHIHKIGGWYYIMLAEGGTGPGHCVTLARARTVTGPYEPAPHNPVLTNRGSPLPIQSTGHADLVRAPDGRLYAVCLGVRDGNGISPLGRETFLTPVEQRDDGWLHFGERRRVQMEVDVPHVESVRPRAAFADDFQNSRAPLFWNRRTAWEDGCIRRGGGYLTLMPNGGTLDDDGPMAFLGLRQTGFAGETAVTLAALPAPGQRAGISVFLTPIHHYDLRLTGTADGPRAELRLRLRQTDIVVSLLPVEAGPVRLSVTFTAEAFQFAVGQNGDRTVLGEASPRLLGATIAKVHTGTFHALFAEGAPEPVRFQDFRCAVAD